MPIYEYQCENCHRLTETLLKVGEKGPKKCAHCGGKLTRVISRTSFQLKGGGWYKDLYASSKPESGGDSESSTSSGSSSSDTKSSPAAETKKETKTETKSGADKPSKTGSAKPAAAPAKKSAAKKAG